VVPEPVVPESVSGWGVSRPAAEGLDADADAVEPASGEVPTLSPAEDEDAVPADTDAAALVEPAADDAPADDAPADDVVAEPVAVVAAQGDAEPAPDSGPVEPPVAAATDDADSSREVTVVPGVPRYHDAGCILIRFMGEGDLEKMTLAAATEVGCTPCRACLPE
jgi:hypothetical protein